MSASQSGVAPQNALSVLLAALPSDVASSIEAGINVVSEELFATGDLRTANPTTQPTSPPQIDTAFISTSRSELSGRPTSGYTARPATEPSASSPTSRPTSQPTWSNSSRPNSHPTLHPTSSSTSHRPTTLATLPSTTSTTSQSTTTTSSIPSAPSSTLTSNASQEPPINPQKQAANGTIAGVATGAIAGVVLLTLALFFLLRRRQRQKALKAVEEKASQPYPEVAWLYDPVQTPPRSRSPPPQGANLAAGGEAGALAKRSSLLAPEVVMPEGEPLLAPGRAATRESSPGASGRASRSASPSVAVR